MAAIGNVDFSCVELPPLNLKADLTNTVRLKYT